MKGTPDFRLLKTLLVWLAIYVAASIGVSYLTTVFPNSRLNDVLPILSNLISMFAGAAFTAMQLDQTGKGKDASPPLQEQEEIKL